MVELGSSTSEAHVTLISNGTSISYSRLMGALFFAAVPLAVVVTDRNCAPPRGWELAATEGTASYLVRVLEPQVLNRYRPKTEFVRKLMALRRAAVEKGQQLTTVESIVWDLDQRS
jgi:hypothetical protein